MYSNSSMLTFCTKMCSLRSIQRKYTTGRPDQKDLSENLAATQGLTHMITECQRLFQVRTHYLFAATFDCLCFIFM